MQKCMNWQSVTYDWNQARAFLATVEEGSLSAAARALGLTQPTLGRQVASLEDRLGVTLFERVGRSLSLTQSGLDLLDHVRTMGDAASRISLAASGQSQSIEGHVCITATDAVSVYLLPDALKRLRDAAPGIEVEVVASNEVQDLRRREADIAIRHGRPQYPDLIAKLVRESSLRLYASVEYLDKYGRPASAGELSEAAFIGFDRSDRLLARLNELGLTLTKDNFKLISESGAVAWEMVKQGLGIGIMAQEIAERTSGVECVLPDLDPVPVPIWLVTHRELHTSRRIRLVFDLLADAFS